MMMQALTVISLSPHEHETEMGQVPIKYTRYRSAVLKLVHAHVLS